MRIVCVLDLWISPEWASFHPSPKSLQQICLQNCLMVKILTVCINCAVSTASTATACSTFNCQQVNRASHHVFLLSIFFFTLFKAWMLFSMNPLLHTDTVAHIHSWKLPDTMVWSFGQLSSFNLFCKNSGIILIVPHTLLCCSSAKARHSPVWWPIN